jgi:FlaA1/EpsC-like NDP-sugar epimerase
MGDPVRIVDLARNMIRLSGNEPDVDIAVEIVGRRPGEKIHEDLFEQEEERLVTPADKIMVAVKPRPDPEWLETAFARILTLVYNGEEAALAAAVEELNAERALQVTASAADPSGTTAERPYRSGPDSH